MPTPIDLDLQLLGPDGRKEQHLHYNNNNQYLRYPNQNGLGEPGEFDGGYNVIFSMTLDCHIHVLSHGMRGPCFRADEDSHIYWWTDASHWTSWLFLNAGCAQQKDIVFTDNHPLIIPAGRNFCLRHHLESPQNGWRQPFGDVYLTMHEPPAPSMLALASKFTKGLLASSRSTT